MSHNKYTKCPQCNTGPISKKTVVEDFAYGALTMQAMVPEYSCKACGFSFTDHEAEETRAATIEAHLAKIG